MNRKYRNPTLPKGILIEKKSGLAFVRVFPHGRLFQKCYGNAEERGVLDTAITDLHRIREQVRLGKFKQEDKVERIIFPKAVQLFLEKHGPTWTHKFVYFREFWKDLYYDELTYLKVKEYRPWRSQHKVLIHGKEKSVEQTTINRELTGLSSMYSHLKRWIALREIRPIEMPVENPVTLVRSLTHGWYDERLNRRKRVLSNEEFNQFMSVATPRIQRTCLAALNTVLRKKDLFALSTKNTVQATRRLEGLQNKVGSLYVVPANDNIVQLFNEADTALLDDTNFRNEFVASRQKFMGEFNAEHFEFRDLRRPALR